MTDKRVTEESSLVDLLECIDDALRNGRLMTRANLAFDIMLKRHLGLTRDDLPAYVEDIKRIDEEDVAAELANLEARLAVVHARLDEVDQDSAAFKQLHQQADDLRQQIHDLGNG